MTNGDLTVPVGADDHVSGPSDAPITLVEYGDFQCSSCGMAYPVVKAAQKALGDRLRFVFRHFPLAQIHEHAEHAAEMAEAAAAQGSFWEMHDMLFEHQNALSDRQLFAYATDAGLDIDRLQHDLRSGALTNRLRADFQSGVDSGVNGTPSFFINGQRYEGDWSDRAQFLEDLRRAAQR